MDRLKILLQYHAEDPQDAFTCFALAQEYAKRGDVSAALKQYESLVLQHPSYTGTYYHLGKLYQSLGRCEEAKSTFECGIEESLRCNAFKDRAELMEALNALAEDG